VPYPRLILSLWPSLNFSAPSEKQKIKLIFKLQKPHQIELRERKKRHLTTSTKPPPPTTMIIIIINYYYYYYYNKKIEIIIN